MQDVIKKIREKLIKCADEKIKETGLNFFKEEILLYGIKSADVKKIGKEYFKIIKDKNKKEIFELCGELWISGYVEEAAIASDWAYAVRKKYEPKDLRVFEKWINNYVNNWASCDTLCNHTVGAFIEIYPDKLSELKKWAKSKNRWMRRASAVSLIIPARRGLFLNDIFEISDILLQDKEDLVQKGYGWMLKEASRIHKAEVFNYVMKHKAIMPRTALRYSIEKIPKDLKAKAMAK